MFQQNEAGDAIRRWVEGFGLVLDAQGAAVTLVTQRAKAGLERHHARAETARIILARCDHIAQVNV